MRPRRTSCHPFAPHFLLLFMSLTIAAGISGSQPYSLAEISSRKIMRQKWLSRLFVRQRKHSKTPSSVFTTADSSGPSQKRTKQRSNNDIDDSETEDDNETLPEDYYSSYEILSPPRPFASVGAALHSILQNRWAASGLQIGLIVYLAHAVWKAASELIEEYSQELEGNNSAFVKREDVVKVLAFLEQDAEAAAAALKALENNKRNSALPPISLLQIAHKLVASGLPLRSDLPVGQAPSVESVLLQLTRSQASILQQCLWTPPTSSINLGSVRGSWNDIAGLELVKERLLTNLSTIRGRHAEAYASLFDSNHATPGVLLYGPPGCGKTMLIKALSSAGRFPCLVVTPSVLLRKYVGETNLQVRALFSLANKLAPCILCIDELDGLFRERSESEHEVSRDLKTEFLQWIDGMMTVPKQADRKVLVIGATNRPFDVDSAILRRLPQAHFVGLPDLPARSALLTKLLRAVPTEKGFDINQIALHTEGYSPSDLRQLLQTAALSGPMRESSLSRDSKVHARPLSTSDVLQALRSVPPTPMSHHYKWALSNFAKSSSVGESSSNDKWETDWGNFYDIGTLHVDHETFNSLNDLLQNMEDFSDNERNGESDDDDL